MPQLLLLRRIFPGLLLLSVWSAVLPERVDGQEITMVSNWELASSVDPFANVDPHTYAGSASVAGRPGVTASVTINCPESGFNNYYCHFRVNLAGASIDVVSNTHIGPDAFGLISGNTEHTATVKTRVDNEAADEHPTGANQHQLTFDVLVHDLSGHRRLLAGFTSNGQPVTLALDLQVPAVATMLRSRDTEIEAERAADKKESAAREAAEKKAELEARLKELDGMLGGEMGRTAIQNFTTNFHHGPLPMSALVPATGATSNCLANIHWSVLLQTTRAVHASSYSPKEAETVHGSAVDYGEMPRGQNVMVDPCYGISGDYARVILVRSNGGDGWTAERFGGAASVVVPVDALAYGSGNYLSPQEQADFQELSKRPIAVEKKQGTGEVTPGSFLPIDLYGKEH